MAFNQTLSAILRGRWLLDKQWADDHLPLVLMMLQGQPVSFIERTGNEGTEQPFILNASTMERYDMYIWDRRQEKYIPNPNIPPNSVGIIPISGPITKYNGDCGEPGAIQRNNWLMDMDRRENIGSVILMMDTPGGESRASHGAVSIITKYSKPILTYVDGISASLGVWYAAATDEIHFSNEMDQMGSIGSYCTLMDMSGYFEKHGVKLHEIYAPQSTDKNKVFNDALKGDYTALEQDLKLMVDRFISFVKYNLPKSAAHEKAWNSGKMFYAQDAIKIGLGDSISDFSKVVSRAHFLGRLNK